MLRSNKTFRKGLLGTAAVALIGAAGSIAAPTDANATAFAYSSIQVTNMVVTTRLADDSVIAGASSSGFDTFTFTSKNLSVQLNAATKSTQSEHEGDDVGDRTNSGGTTDVIVGPGGNANVLTTDTSGSFIDLQQICLGDCGFTNNVYTAPAVNPAGNHAVADSHMSNTVLNGSAAFGVQAGANSSSGGTFSSGDTATGNLMNWNFTADANDVELILTWDEVRSLLVSKTESGESATAQLNFSIILQGDDGTNQTMFNLLTDDVTDINDLNNLSPTLIAGQDLPLEIETFAADSVSSEEGRADLTAGVTYNLVFAFDASAEATSPSIPEPGTLALLGAGLFGLGALRNRRRKKATA